MQIVTQDTIFEKHVTFNGDVTGLDGQSALTILNSDGSFFGYYPDDVVTVADMGGALCDPVIAIGGSGLTDLIFSNCGYEAPGNEFTLPDTSGLTSLKTLYFTNCGYSGLLISDTSGLTALKFLEFSGCGYGLFTLPDLSGLTALESLRFSGCGYGGNFSIGSTSNLTALKTLEFSACGQTFNLTDLSGLTSLTSLSFYVCSPAYQFIIPSTSSLTALETLSFSNCGGDGFTLPDTVGLTALTSLSFYACGYSHMTLPDTTQEVGLLSNLVSFSIGQYCGNVQASQLALIATALVYAGNTDGTFTVSTVSTTIIGDKTTLNAQLAILSSRGWTVLIT